MCGCVSGARRGNDGSELGGSTEWQVVAMRGAGGGEGVVRRRWRLRAQAAQCSCTGGAEDSQAARRGATVWRACEDGARRWRRGRTTAVWRSGWSGGGVGKNEGKTGK